jgi:hypothetical protein
MAAYGFMSFGLSSSDTKDDIELLRQQVTNFSQYAVSQFALKDNAIKKMSQDASTLTLRINGIEKAPLITFDLKSAKLNATTVIPLGVPSYQENNADERLLVDANGVTLTLPGIYMISYIIFASAAPASFAWYDAQTNALIPGSELVIPITKKSASATTIIRIPEGSAFRMTLKMTQGRQISILAPSRISISGITVRAQGGV